MVKRKRKDYLQVNQGIQGGEGLALGRPILGTNGSSLDFKGTAGFNKHIRLSGSIGAEKEKSPLERGKKEKSPYFVADRHPRRYLWDM